MAGWNPDTIVSFASQSGWDLLSGSASFATALTQVDLIGISVQHLNLDVPLAYGLDDWQLRSAGGVPEPGIVSVTIAALVSLGLARRRMRRQADEGSDEETV